MTSSRVSLVSPLITLALGEADFDGVGVAEALGIAVGIGDVVDFGVGVAIALTTVPLFQTSFFPDLTQKYLTPPVVLVFPTFEQVVPVMVTACEGMVRADSNIVATRTVENTLNLIA